MARSSRAQSILNAVALVGWTGVIGALLVNWPSASLDANSKLLRAVQILEGICLYEVGQIVFGVAKGNWILGVCLHLSRVVVSFLVFPAVPATLSTKLSLLAWCITEICRYPMFLLPSSKLARTARYLAPLLTFPLGAFSEAVSCYASLPLIEAPLKYLPGFIAPYNCIGFFLGYQQMAKKALQELKPASSKK